MKPYIRTLSITFAAAIAIAALAAPAYADVSVVVNGSGVSFDQPPIERAGRVFVPLRGVFERLGASVVYDNGQINATGNGRNISLTIGSTQASVGGQAQTLDVAPFVVGSRTLVPLRFVAQALGAAVSWDQDSQTVTITGGNGGNSGNRGNGGSSYNPPMHAFSLMATSPVGVVRRSVPTISARFSEAVSRSTVRIWIDDVEITSDATVTSDGFTSRFPRQLSQGSHSVRVTGSTRDGHRFNAGWTFRTVQGL